MARDPEKLQVFHHAHHLTLDVYRLTDRLPGTERYGLSAQLRRAATSVPTNIVEGCRRRTPREYQQFLDVALGSASEVSYLLGLAVDLSLLTTDDAAYCRECSDHVVRALQNLLKAVSQFPP
jgi:four helix bundle protein